ncbi:MAG TPA: hypothetical protein VJN18_09350 [Polyangiaceae bacterium]|nr:hypothetical protein [Polyangiaceae bacterium]
MTNKRIAWSRAGSLWGRVGYVLVALMALGAIAGCSKKKDEEAKATAEKAEAEKKKKKPQGDRYADGKRLEAALKDWTKRWGDTAELPACDPLLKEAADLELCKTAATSLIGMKAAIAKPEPEATLIKAAADLAFATENASEKLRAASMEKQQAEHKTGPAGSGSPLTKVPASAFSAMPKARPIGSAITPKAPGAGKLADKLKTPTETAPPDPGMQVMQAYSRVNRAALRYLSQFLQFGPLPTRRVTFGELEGLSKRKETWPALGRTLREAAMAENDPDLQGKLKSLAPKLSRGGARPAGEPGAPGMPPGHPAVPDPGATPPAPEKK